MRGFSSDDPEDRYQPLFGIGRRHRPGNRDEDGCDGECANQVERPGGVKIVVRRIVELHEGCGERQFRRRVHHGCGGHRDSHESEIVRRQQARKQDGTDETAQIDDDAPRPHPGRTLQHLAAAMLSHITGFILQRTMINLRSGNV